MGSQRRLDQTLECILCVVAVGTSLIFGGVQPWVYLSSTAVILVALAVLLVRQTVRGSLSVPLPLWPLLFAAFVLLQLIPLPPALVAWLSPSRLQDLTPALPASGQNDWVTLSIYPRKTAEEFLKLLLYLSAFLLSSHVFDGRRGRSSLVKALVGLGVFQAVYGIVQYLTGWHQIFWYTKQYDLEDATGTYINRNHFAGLLELTWPLVVGMIYSSLRRSAGPSSGRNKLKDLQPFQTPVFFYGLLLLVMFLAVILSRSRAGILVSVFVLIFLGLLAQLRFSRKTWAIGVSLFLLVAAGYGLWIGLDPVLARFEHMRGAEYLRIEGRVGIWRDTVRMASDYPVFGCGFGSYAQAYRAYQTTAVTNFVDHAHNDYLQVAAETGVPGLLLLFLPIFVLLGRLISVFLRDVRTFRSGVALGCVGSLLALLLHSLADFNLQIPANALTFSIVLGIGYRIAYLEGWQAAPSERRPGTS